MHATPFTFDRKLNLTISDKHSCILIMQWCITKRTQINLSWMDITILVPVLQNMKTGNDVTECIEKQSAHSIRSSCTLCWFASTSPIITAIQLAQNQSDNPMAQTSDGPPPQTSYVELEQTTSAWLRKLPAQLNTPNIFVPDLVRISPNASDVQRLGWCVPAFSKMLFGAPILLNYNGFLTFLHDPQRCNNLLHFKRKTR